MQTASHCRLRGTSSSLCCVSPLQHPECEIYDRQQAGQPPPPQAAPTKRRPVQIADRSGGQKRGAVQAAVEAPSTFVPAKRRAALREGYYRALQDGKVAGASDWGEQARHEDEGGLRTGADYRQAISVPAFRAPRTGKPLQSDLLNLIKSWTASNTRNEMRKWTRSDTVPGPFLERTLQMQLAE